MQLSSSIANNCKLNVSFDEYWGVYHKYKWNYEYYNKHVHFNYSIPIINQVIRLCIVLNIKGKLSGIFSYSLHSNMKVLHEVYFSKDNDRTLWIFQPRYPQPKVHILKNLKVTYNFIQLHHRIMQNTKNYADNNTHNNQCNDMPFCAKPFQ